MFALTFTRAEQTRTFTITTRPNAGWEVCEEADSVVTRRAQYEDWHRVERARRNFEKEAESAGYSTNR